MEFIYEKIVNRIKDELKRGVLPWRKSWHTNVPNQGYLTNHVYTGINKILTNMQDYSCPYWATFQQIKKLNGKVLKSSKATNLLWFSVIENKRDPSKNYAVAKCYNVFNLEQTTLKIPEDADQSLNFNPIERAEQTIRHFTDRPKNNHGSDGAYYHVKLDQVFMPDKASFFSEESYYDVLFHELAHSTGHHERLNREGINKINGNSKDIHSYEELIAQISSAFLCAEVGIDNIIESSSYIEGWLRFLEKNGARTLVTAASEAERAVQYIKNGHNKTMVSGQSSAEVLFT